MKFPKSFLGFLLLSGFGSAEQKPNILFILIDDLGWSDVGCYGSAFHETPHIDRLAKQGMKFSNAYAASAICSTTRASILTGKYPSRPEIGITRATPQQSLPLKEITYAEVLKRCLVLENANKELKVRAHTCKDKNEQLATIIG